MTSTGHRLLDLLVHGDLAALVRSEMPDQAERLRHSTFHVGFLAADLGAAQRLLKEAGLVSPRVFPSAVLARQLGVPTTIVQADRPDGRGFAEAFVPAAPPVRVAAWIASGEGEHVGVSVPTLQDLEDLRVLLTARGYAVPAFMGGQPMENGGERLRLLYFDRPPGLRLEVLWRS